MRCCPSAVVQVARPEGRPRRRRAKRGGPSAPNGPNGPLRGSESTKAGDPHSAGPSAGGAALRAPPLALG
eukprot:13951294-Alexandrium_andersonii.AAC.1